METKEKIERLKKEIEKGKQLKELENDTRNDDTRN